MANYYMLGGDGKEYGPVSAEQLRQWAIEGRANAQTQIRPVEGGGSWVSFAAVPELNAPPSGYPAASAPPYGAPASAPMPGGPKPSNYLVQAILVTLFCCLPFGIVALIFASQVDSKYTGGNYAGALESSGKAKFWCWMAFWFGFVPLVLYFIIMVIAAATGGLSHQ